MAKGSPKTPGEKRPSAGRKRATAASAKTNAGSPLQITTVKQIMEEQESRPQQSRRRSGGKTKTGTTQTQKGAPATGLTSPGGTIPPGSPPRKFVHPRVLASLIKNVLLERGQVLTNSTVHTYALLINHYIRYEGDQTLRSLVNDFASEPQFARLADIVDYVQQRYGLGIRLASKQQTPENVRPPSGAMPTAKQPKKEQVAETRQASPKKTTEAKPARQTKPQSQAHAPDVVKVYTLGQRPRYIVRQLVDAALGQFVNDPDLKDNFVTVLMDYIRKEAQKGRPPDQPVGHKELILYTIRILGLEEYANPKTGHIIIPRSKLQKISGQMSAIYKEHAKTLVRTTPEAGKQLGDEQQPTQEPLQPDTPPEGEPQSTSQPPQEEQAPQEAPGRWGTGFKIGAGLAAATAGLGFLGMLAGGGASGAAPIMPGGAYGQPMEPAAFIPTETPTQALRRKVRQANLMMLMRHMPDVYNQALVGKPLPRGTVVVGGAPDASPGLEMVLQYMGTGVNPTYNTAGGQIA